MSPMCVHCVVLVALALLANLKATTGAWVFPVAGVKVKKPLMVKPAVCEHAVPVGLAGKAEVRAVRAERARMRMLKVYMVID